MMVGTMMRCTAAQFLDRMLGTATRKMTADMKQRPQMPQHKSHRGDGADKLSRRWEHGRQVRRSAALTELRCPLATVTAGSPSMYGIIRSVKHPGSAERRWCKSPLKSLVFHVDHGLKRALKLLTIHRVRVIVIRATICLLCLR